MVLINRKEREYERRQIEVDEINLRYKDCYKYAIYSKVYDRYTPVMDGLIDECRNSEEALEDAKNIGEYNGLDMDNYDVTIFKWIPATYLEDGQWEEVDFIAVENIKKLKDLEGKTIKNITIKTREQDELTEISIDFTDNTDITIQPSNNSVNDYLNFFKLPF